MTIRFSFGIAIGLFFATVLAIGQGVNAPQGGTLTLYDTNGNSYTFPAASGTVSLDGVTAFGAITMTTPAATVTTSGTPVKVAGTTTLGDATNFDMPANNRLRYTGATTAFFNCSLHMSKTVSLNNRLMSIFLSDTGVVDTTSEIRLDHGTGTVEISSGTSFIVQLAQNEFVEAFVDSDSGSPSVTANRMSMACSIIN